MTVNPVLFGILLTVSLIISLIAVYRRFSLLKYARSDYRFDKPAERVKSALSIALAQKKVLARPFGYNHAFIFWSFLVLAVANTLFIIEGLVPGFSLESLIPLPAFNILILCFDIASLAALICVKIAFARRIFFKPDYLDSRYVKGRSFEGFLILTFIALLMLAYFVMNGALYAAMGIGSHFAPISTFVAYLLKISPLSDQLFLTAEAAWWTHAVVLCAFIAFLPMSKHLHILTAIPNCYFSRVDRRNYLEREEFSESNSYGVEKVSDFTWKDILDSFSCTECGRCQDACPANRTGKPLNPRQVIHSIKTNILKNRKELASGKSPEHPIINGETESSNTESTIWSCTTCGACMTQCPVMIEQMPKIIKMRRYLVEMKSEFPEELLNLFENMEQRSNPWGIAPPERVKWTSTLNVPEFSEGTTEYLFYVGCAGSFDSRTKQITVSLASILDAAGISYGILGKDEKCCGDSARRLGNEYLFELMALENVRIFKERGVKKVITLCPHCFTTLSNDYRQYGADLEVMHHSQLIDSLIKQGKLSFQGKEGIQDKIIFHDSCYLGRHNDVYAEPRNVITAANGTAPSEFDRNMSNSFCCGAGGGRMWMEEHEGERINQNRVKEAINAKADTVCVACPYCMTMFEDGVKELKGEKLKIKDIAEIVAERLKGI